MRPSEALNRHRDAIRRIAESHRVRNVRVFGSAMRRTDKEGSDLDLLVEPTDQTTLFDLAAITVELKALLGIDVDVLTPNSLPDKFRARVVGEAMPV
jgi:predicted nucleotidyltransferase